MALFFAAPFIQILTLVLFVVFILTSLLDIQVVSGITKLLFSYNVLSIILAYIITVLLSTFVVLVENKKIKKTFKGILTFSIFMFTWIPIHLICLVTKETKWEPTEHSRIIDIDSIIDSNAK